MDKQFALSKRVIIKLFKLEEKASRPDMVVGEILAWTNSQPILTQKLCRLIHKSEAFIHTGEEAKAVAQLVQTRLIDQWETQVASDHLKTIQDGLLNNQTCDPILLLQQYKQILQDNGVSSDGSPVQAELLTLGLLEQQQNTLKVANRIYQSVFDRNWVKAVLANGLKPPSAMANTSSQPTIPTNLDGPEPVQTKPESNVSSDESLTQQSVADRNWVGKVLANRLQPSSATTNISSQSTPVDTTSDASTTSSPLKRLIFARSIWALLGIAGLLVVGFSLFRWLQVETIFKRGNEQLSQKNYQPAIDEYNKLLNLDSNYYQAWTNRGYGLAGLKDYSKMLESCTTATIIEPKSTYAWNCQGEALYNLKRYDEAIAAFDKAIVVNPQDPVFWINKTESLISLKRSDAAITSINQAIAILRQNQGGDRNEETIRELSIALSYKGKALSQKQDHDAALEAYEQSLTYDPNYFTALRGKGIALEGLQRYDDAIAQFQKILDRSDLSSEQKAEAGFYLGLTLCESNQPAKAIAAFDKALALKPNYPAAEQAKKNCNNEAALSR
jgi:tetratricopeptide (TPR) repeat protein